MRQIEITKKPEQKTANVPALVIGGRFSRFKKEDEKAIRKTDVSEDQVLAQMKQVWKAHDIPEIPGALETELYYELISNLSLPDYSSDDVEKLSLALAEFQNEKWFSYKAGIFLSALINKGKEKDYTIHTQHLEPPIYYLGYRNRKNIIVEGDVGDHLGDSMKCGTIRVRGNGGTSVGNFMEGGLIIVEGNVKGNIGYSLEGGRIIVEGNASGCVGNGMNAGTITIKGLVNGDIGPSMSGGEIHIGGGDYISVVFSFFASNPCGKIYHMGKLIWDNGKYVIK
jgi:hypothetical protein